MTADTTNEKIIHSDNDHLDLSVSDEIVVRDKDGNFKVMIGGKLHEFDGIAPSAALAKKTAPPEELFTKPGLVPEEPVSEQLMPPPPALWQKQEGAAFYFHPEDEAEVEAIAKDKGVGGPVDISTSVQKIIKQSGITFPDAERQAQLAKVITARLKHMREQAETRDTLTRPVPEGGLGLSPADANVLMALIGETLSQLESAESVEPQSELDKLVRQADDIYEFSDSVPTPAATSDHGDLLAADLVKERPEFTRAPSFSEPPRPPVETPSAPPVRPRPQPVEPGRRKISDVTSVGRARGPIDELKFLNLTELRRIGTNPLDNISRIKDKIESLEEESFNKKVEGIKAWRQSPLYNMYVEIGRQSMEEGKSISQVIAQRQQRGDDTLSQSEFERITDLNQELRF